MADNPRTEITMEELVLAGLVLQIADREAALADTSGRAKTELVLHGAGLDNATIGTLLNKPQKSVGQTIRRATDAKDIG